MEWLDPSAGAQKRPNRTSLVGPDTLDNLKRQFCDSVRAVLVLAID